MNSDSPIPAALEIECALPEFTPVPTARNRHDGWTPDCQRRFLAALMAMGTVGHAARAVGRSPVSAYNLRRRSGSESFAQAWDFAIGEGRARAYAWAMERSINGYTTYRLRLGGTIEVEDSFDRRSVMAVLKEAPARRKAR